SRARRQAWAKPGFARRKPRRPGARELDAVLEALCFRQGLELLQRVVLDLANALARDAEGAADLLERARALALETEAKLDHLALALGKRVQGTVDVLSAKVERRGVEGRLGLVVLHEIAELGL